jgi:hypothetical protein
MFFVFDDAKVYGLDRCMEANFDKNALFFIAYKEKNWLGCLMRYF